MTRDFPRAFAAVVFDLDGTLIHSAPDIAAHLNTILTEEGLAPFPVAETYRFIGSGAHRLIADAFADRGRAVSDVVAAELTRRYVALYEREGSPLTTLYPDVEKTLADLWGLPLGICTNKAESVSRAALTAMGIAGRFGAVIGSDSGFGRKPDAGPLHEVCRQIGVTAEHVLLVGDTKTDVATARASGAAVAVVRYGYSQSPVDGLGADAVLASIADVMTLIDWRGADSRGVDRPGINRP